MFVKDPKTHRRLENKQTNKKQQQRFLIKKKKTRDRRQIFEEILFFKATYRTKTNKQMICLLPVGFLRKEEVTRLTYSDVC